MLIWLFCIASLAAVIWLKLTSNLAVIVETWPFIAAVIFLGAVLIALVTIIEKVFVPTKTLFESDIVDSNIRYFSSSTEFEVLLAERIPAELQKLVGIWHCSVKDHAKRFERPETQRFLRSARARDLDVYAMSTNPMGEISFKIRASIFLEKPFKKFVLKQCRLSIPRILFDPFSNPLTKLYTAILE